MVSGLSGKRRRQEVRGRCRFQLSAVRSNCRGHSGKNVDNGSGRKMLQHHAAQYQVVVTELDRVVDEIKMSELPRSVGELLAVMFDLGFNDIDTGIVDVKARLQEAAHPAHVSARHVQQSDPRQAELTFYFVDDRV